MGVSLNGVKGLDINVEKKVVEEKLKMLQQQGASENETKFAMKDLGIKRLTSIKLKFLNFNNIFFIIIFSF